MSFSNSVCSWTLARKDADVSLFTAVKASSSVVICEINLLLQSGGGECTDDSSFTCHCCRSGAVSVCFNTQKSLRD